MPDNALAEWLDRIDKKFGFTAGSGGGTSTASAPETKPAGAPAAPAAGSRPAGGPAAPATGGPATGAPAKTGAGKAPATAAPSAPTSGTPAPASGPPSSSPAGTPTGDAPSSTDQPTTPQASGSGAKGQADAAESAAKAGEGVAAKVKPLETELQKLAQEGEQHKTEATTAKTTAEQALQGISAPPSVAAPQGQDPKARYDSAIQISGDMRKARADAEAKATDARGQETVAKTAVTSVSGKLTAAGKKAQEAKVQSELAAQHSKAAANAAQQAEQEAAKSKSAADQAAGDDPNKAALQKTAQEDAGHVSRAKAAAGKAAAAAKQASTSATQAESHLKTLESAKEAAQQASDAVEQSVAGIGSKLTPYADAVGQAETQEAECKNALSAEDAEAVLQKRYEELGGDGELRKALAAEDAEAKTAVETFRAKIKDWQKDRKRELDEQKTGLESSIQQGDQIMPAIKEWREREGKAHEAASSRAQAIEKEKLDTEPGKEALSAITTHGQTIEEVGKLYEQNAKMLEQTKAMLETVKTRYTDVDKTYEAAEEYTNTLTTELDNDLEKSSMTLEQKVDYLQARPKPVRDRVQKQLDAEHQRVLQSTVADTEAEQPEFSPEAVEFQPTPIDWGPIDAKLSELESKSKEELETGDPAQATMREEYEAAGGDKALFDKRVAEWKKAMADHTEQDKRLSDNYRSKSGELQRQVDDAGKSIDTSQRFIDQSRATVAAHQSRIKELESKVDPATGQGLTPQETAEHKRLERAVAQLEKEIAAREKMLASQVTAKENAEKLRDQTKTKYETAADDDAQPEPAKPTPADVHALPLRVKYTELTGKAAPG